MVSVKDSHSHSLSHSFYSPSRIWRDSGARSMRTVRSHLFSPSPPPSSAPPPPDSGGGAATTTPTFLSSEQNLTDSAIDIRLNELASKSRRPSFLSDDFLLDSHSFSDSYSLCSSDISGELHRLATTENHHSTTTSSPSTIIEPCPNFLNRDHFSTEIIDAISPEDLLPTVSLCVTSLSSPSAAVIRSSAAKLRLLAKHRSDNRLLIAHHSSAVFSLVSLLKSTDPVTQEHAVTAILNLSLHDDNKRLIIDTRGSIKSLIYVLKTGTETSKQNAAAALMSLAMAAEETRLTIGASGAIPPLVSLLINGTSRGKKDALTTLYKLCSVRVNKERAVKAGVVAPLVELVVAEEGEGGGGGTGVADKALVVMSSLAGVEEGRRAVVEEGGVAALVEAVESGSQKGKEFAVVTLLQLCAESVMNRGLLVAEGGIPPLVALSQSGTARAKHKAETLLRYLREPRDQEASSSAP